MTDVGIVVPPPPLAARPRTSKARSLGLDPRYDLVRLVARGGMATVHLALDRNASDPGGRQVVAIKRIHDELLDDGRIRRMFATEADVLARMDHPNIARALDTSRARSHGYYAMEFISGLTLPQLIRAAHRGGRRLPLPHALSLVIEIADALSHAHSRDDARGTPLDLVHCDVAPANLVLGYDGGVSLIDFGIAQTRANAFGLDELPLVGTMAYMSPEQCVGQPLDRRSDVFSLGVVLWELATWRRLFRGADRVATRAAIAAGRVPRPSIVAAEVPQSLERIIMRALHRDPSQRYRGAEDLRHALQEFVHLRALEITAEERAHWMAHTLD